MPRMRCRGGRTDVPERRLARAIRRANRAAAKRVQPGAHAIRAKQGAASRRRGAQDEDGSRGGTHAEDAMPGEAGRTIRSICRTERLYVRNGCGSYPVRMGNMTSHDISQAFPERRLSRAQSGARIAPPRNARNRARTHAHAIRAKQGPASRQRGGQDEGGSRGGTHAEDAMPGEAGRMVRSSCRTERLYVRNGCRSCPARMGTMTEHDIP